MKTLHASLSRRDFARAALAGGLALAGVAHAGEAGRFGPPRPFSRDWLVKEAQRRARLPYAPRLASHMVADFDAHVRLSYGPAEAVASQLRLFPARRDTAPDKVTIHVVAHGMARELIDTHGVFGGGETADVAGFRVMNTSGGGDWLAFLGASYFRAAGASGQYGLSARAVAVDTGLPGPEEFPAFTDFWIEAQGPDRLMIHALVDGPSLCGAFGFATRRTPSEVEQDVEAALFLRRDIARLGLAPITSMFDYDQSSPRADWRGEVHDSDGLAIVAGNGERIWRPLDNPPGPRVHMLRADHLRGFGLLQRDTSFDHYQDDLNFYDRRPSLWVEPRGDWGAGAVMLYEMNTITETVDNMAVMWVPDAPAKAGQRKDFACRLRWCDAAALADGVARCIDVFAGPGGVPGAEAIAGATRYVFDFAGGSLAGLPAGSVVPVTNLPAAALIMGDARAVAGQAGVWRVTLDVRTQGLAQDDFRLFLRHGVDAASETVIKTVRP
ncbi:MAG: glucan biosynthesis protein [Sphingomonadales bacterium]|nr:glucan biosynthesis protein [Sphingomonadales bacterium]